MDFCWNLSSTSVSLCSWEPRTGLCTKAESLTIVGYVEVKYLTIILSAVGLLESGEREDKRTSYPTVKDVL